MEPLDYRRRVARAALFAAFFLGSAALAQGSSVLTGTVTDAATKQPVADVVITATSPALLGEQLVVTDSTGLYRLPNLPAGAYTIRLEKEAYKPFSRGDISIRVDRTIRVNVELLPEALRAEEVVVVGRAPSIDVGSTTTGINVGKDFVNNVAFVRPTGTGMRSFESLASVAPQVVGDTYGYGMNGTTSPENAILIDGLSVTNPAYGVNGSPFPIEFFEEANIITGGYMAEYGRATGGVMNVVTKSGSNEFHGSVFGNLTPGSLTAKSPIIKSQASLFESKSEVWNSGDFGAEVGGPIMKDKLWFYAGFSPSFNRDRETRSLNHFLLVDTDGDGALDDYDLDEDGNRKAEPLPGTLESRFVDSRAMAYVGKLTYGISADQNVSLSILGSNRSEVVPFSFSNRMAGTRDTSDSRDVSLRYQAGLMDKKVLLDATLGWHRQDSSSLPNDGSKLGDTTGAAGTPVVIFRRSSPHSILDFEELPPEAAALCEQQGSPKGAASALACPATGSGSTYAIGGAGFMDVFGLDRYQGKLGVTYLLNALGHHVLKAGLDLERMQYDVQKAYSGGVMLRQSGSGGSFTDYRQYAYLTGPDTMEKQPVVHTVSGSNGLGAYLQDSWQVADLFTLNMGLRYESQQLYGADGTVGMSLNNMISPRVGLIYDPTQQGRSKLYGSYATYYESVPLDIADRSLSGENQAAFVRFRTANKDRKGCDPLKDINQVLDQCQDENNRVPLAAIGVAGPSDPSQLAMLTGQGKTPVDPNLIPQSTNELVVGGDYEVLADGRAGVFYTMRRMNHVIEDMSRDEASTYFIGNPGYGIAKDFPKATRDYDAVTLYFNKTFTDLWLAQVSYTNSWLRGNWDGLFRPESGQLDPNINSDFDLRSLLTNRTGLLNGDRTHYLKAYGAKEFVISGGLSFVTGMSYLGRSGRPVSYLASHPIYGGEEAFVLARGSAGRTPWVHSVDGKIGLNYKLTKSNVVTASVDLFNILNWAGVTSVDSTYSTSDLLPQPSDEKKPAQTVCFAEDGNCSPTLKKIDPETGEIVDATKQDINPNFMKDTGYQDPRSVRFGLKVTF